MVLTERQKKDLNLAILEYLETEGASFSKTVSALKEEAGITEAPDLSRCILEKKWTSVVRLQRKIMELESKLESVQSQPLFNGSFRPGSGLQTAENSSSSSSENRNLPRGPAKALLSGHRAPVTAVAAHPKYSVCASSSEDTTIKIWDYETAQYERTLKGHTEVVTGIVFDITGNTLASCSADMSAKLWDLATYTCIRTFKGHDHTLSSIQYSLSGDQIITCGRDQTIKCWDVTTGYCLNTFVGHTDWVKCLSVSLDGELLASGSHDQTIIVWKLSTGQKMQVLRGHEHVVESVAFGKKNSSSSSSSLTVPINDKINDKIDGKIDNLEVTGGICLMTFASHENWVRCVIFHPSGKYLISSSDDKTIRILDIKEGRCLRTIGDAHGHFVTTVAMSKAHPILLSGSVDKSIGIWSCS